MFLFVAMGDRNAGQLVRSSLRFSVALVLLLEATPTITSRLVKLPVLLLTLLAAVLDTSARATHHFNSIISAIATVDAVALLDQPLRTLSSLLGSIATENIRAESIKVRHDLDGLACIQTGAKDFLVGGNGSRPHQFHDFFLGVETIIAFQAVCHVGTFRSTK